MGERARLRDSEKKGKKERERKIAKERERRRKKESRGKRVTGRMSRASERVATLSAKQPTLIGYYLSAKKDVLPKVVKNRVLHDPCMIRSFIGSL